MNIPQPHIVFHSFESEVEAFNEFLNIYYPVKVILLPDNPMAGLKMPKDRICRFCQKSSPDVTFKKEAHVISRSLGNRFLISDFECDDCNAAFGKNENDLNNWLGIIRTIAGTKGRKGIPEYRSVSELVIAKMVDFFKVDGTKIAFNDASAFTFNETTGEAKFEYKKGPYTPIKVYKAFLKMALSFIEDRERPDYKPAFDFLSGPDDNGGFKMFAKIICQELPAMHQVIKPCAIFFERINEDVSFPKHFFSLYYENIIYSFPIPFNLNDLRDRKDKKIDFQITYPPPILFVEPEGGSRFANHFENLGFIDRRKNEKGTVYFNTSLADYENIVACDPETGEVTPADMKSVKVADMYFVPEGTTIETGKKFTLP